jgi:hypothetical protein
MVEKLDEIEWANYTHAYGTAEDIPILLRAVLLPKPLYRHIIIPDWADVDDDAVACMGYSIFHQGSLYDAALPTIPFLIELVAHEDTPKRTYILSFIYAMAGAWTQVRAKAVKSQKLWEYHSLERQVYNLISEYIDLYKMLLNSPDAQLKEMARRILVRLNRVKPDYREDI